VATVNPASGAVERLGGPANRSGMANLSPDGQTLHLSRGQMERMFAALHLGLGGS